MIEPKPKAVDENSPIFNLGAVAALAAVLTMLAGFFVYSTIRSLAASKDWVEHTQEILTSNESIAQLLERVESSSFRYTLDGDQPELDTAQTAAIALEAEVLNLKALTADTPSETANIAGLLACTSGVEASVRSLVPAQKHVPQSFFACREILTRMAGQDRALLKERVKRSQHSSVVSITSDWILVGFFLLTLAGLFSLLLRDALLRRRIARQTALTQQNVQALERHIRETLLLTFCRDELQLCAEVQQAYRSAASCFERLLPESSGALCIFNTQRNLLEVASVWGGNPVAKVADTFLPEACCGLRLGQLRWRRSGMSEVECSHFNGGAPSRYVCIPMVAQGDTLGVLYIECVDDSIYLSLQRRLEGMREILQLTGMTVAALHLRTKLESQSVRDSLTGLFNRHFMEIVLERELAIAARQQTPLALLMIDVDHFKRFNDSFGHLAGDAMLKAVAEVFHATVRTEDTVCRYGGEEFVILLPGVTPEVAFERAELIREAVRRLRVPVEANVTGETTISVGIALCPNDALQAEPLLRRADQALYRAKQNGRNRVSLSEVLSTAR